MAFFFLCVGMSVHKGIDNLANADDEDHVNTLGLFTYLYPFVCFIIDPSVRRAFNIRSKSCYVLIKVISIFVYLLFYVMSLQLSSESTLYWIATANYFIFPIMNITYWALLITKKL